MDGDNASGGFERDWHAGVTADIAVLVIECPGLAFPPEAIELQARWSRRILFARSTVLSVAIRRRLTTSIRGASSLRILIKSIGALSIIAASFFVTLWVMSYVSPTCPQGTPTALTRPFDKLAQSGFAYTKALPNLDSVSDSSDTPTRSKLLVCENNNLLGPMHSAHADIGKEGHGRYSHWTTYLVFSASDNTDPNTNGRTYSVVQPR
jgi:hypothetical protein